MEDKRRSALDGSTKEDHRGHGCSFDPAEPKEKLKFTTVYLASGRTAYVDGDETELTGDVLYVYPVEGEAVTFNWNHVEFFKKAETDMPTEEQIEEYRDLVKKSTAGSMGPAPAGPLPGIGTYL